MTLEDEERATVECVERAWRAYIDCALWSSCDDEGTPLDQRFGPDDMSLDMIQETRGTVYAFLTTCWDEGYDLSAIEPEQLGHDLWLTQNRHGAGFWDRGLGDLGDRLTALAHPFGEAYIVIGDDELLYMM